MRSLSCESGESLRDLGVTFLSIRKAEKCLSEVMVTAVRFGCVRHLATSAGFLPVDSERATVVCRVGCDSQNAEVAKTRFSAPGSEWLIDAIVLVLSGMTVRAVGW